jgi:hypothetical protein
MNIIGEVKILCLGKCLNFKSKITGKKRVAISDYPVFG